MRWRFQVLRAAGQMAGLLLEIERARHGPRKPATESSALGPATVRSPDGAAPLIGSTAVMRMLRHRIERVAATDFIVLVEGGSGPEAHPDLGVHL
jgi:DNA-binding NtrC family response regulator